jgi:hypothetical protein
VVQSFPSQQRPHFTIRALGRSFDDLTLVGCREPSPCGAGLHLSRWILAIAC